MLVRESGFLRGRGIGIRGAAVPDCAGSIQVGLPFGPSMAFAYVQGNGRFFAEAWKNPQQATPAAAGKMQQDIDNDLKRLAENLPERFLATVKQVRAGLPAVFALLPFVLNHGDLSETNMLVDTHDGRITGIIDWAEAEVSPFGLSLWGLESLLGYGRKGKFYFYDNAEQLRDEFWSVFEAEIGTTAALSEEVKHAIKIARMAGLLLSWCFIYDQDMARQKVRDTDGDLGRADAFCARGI